MDFFLNVLNLLKILFLGAGGGHTYIGLFQSWVVNITITNSSCFWALASANLKLLNPNENSKWLHKMTELK